MTDREKKKNMFLFTLDWLNYCSGDTVMPGIST